MKRSPERHLGLVAYCWGMSEQSRLLASCLAPAVADLRGHGLRRFWFDRFDARGPHVFALFTVPSERFEEVRNLLDSRLAAWLADHPCQVEITEEELIARHRACRGIALCEVDAEEGFAANNTVRFFEQPHDGYPFTFGRSLADPDQLWDLLDGLTAWMLDRLAREPGSTPTDAGVRWLASLAHILPRHFVAPEAYWHHHVASLIPNLQRAADDEEMVRRVTRALGERNEAALAAVWEGARPEPLPWPDLPRLLDLLASADSSKGPGPKELLRMIVHIALKQLGVPIKLQRTLLLYGWKQNLVT
jgi:hypothetical protein